MEHSIKKSAELMLKNVQFLEAPGSSANREGRHLNETEYKRLELPEKELLALESGTSHSVPTPSLPT